MSDIERLKTELARVERQREHLLYSIALLEGRDPDEVTHAATSEVAEEPASVPRGSNGGAKTIRPDEYFGMSQHVAAKTYLKNLGHADRIENILKAIVAGGTEVGGANPLQTLRATLARNTTTFVRVAAGTFGLREFYPHVGERPQSRRRRPTDDKDAMDDSEPDQAEA